MPDKVHVQIVTSKTVRTLVSDKWIFLTHVPAQPAEKDNYNERMVEGARRLDSEVRGAGHVEVGIWALAYFGGGFGIFVAAKVGFREWD
jgi:hypothetical protein